MTTPVATWLDPADVQTWLVGSFPGITVDQTILADCTAAAEPPVERARPDMFLTTDDADGSITTTYVPDAEVYTAARMLAARLYVRRNSAAGVEVYTGASAVMARYEPDIERALKTSGWRRVVFA